jgi:hypothetical protein
VALCPRVRVVHTEGKTSDLGVGLARAGGPWHSVSWPRIASSRTLRRKAQVPRPRQNPPTAQTRPRKPNPWVGLGLSQQTRGRVVFWQTQPKTHMGTLYNPKKQKKLTCHFTLNCAVIFDYIMVLPLSGCLCLQLRVFGTNIICEEK